MKRLSLLGFVGLLSSILAGCPIFDHSPQGDTSSCDGDCTSTGSSNPGGCLGPKDCGNNETCGQDRQCHPGDCTTWGCNDGFTCVVDPTTQTASCQPSGSSGSGGASSSTSTSSSGSGGSSVVYCGNPKDCSAGQTCAPDITCHVGDCTTNGCIYGFTCSANGSCVASNPATCSTDVECAGLGAGYACVSGLCTQPSDQCWDQTTCAAGNKCAAGKCTPGCTAAADCAAGSGYTCDTTLGLCTKPVKGCKITNDCGGAKTVCVAGACIPRSAGPTCPSGKVWDLNGCIPSQSATFFCTVDGMQDVCAAGSLCLHHNCYISCVADPMVCTNQPTLNQCKPVTTSSGAHSVCGSKQNLGGECDPTDPKMSCAGGVKICVDGFCK